MKKFLAVILAGVMCIGLLAACSSGQTTTTAAAAATTEAQTATEAAETTKAAETTTAASDTYIFTDDAGRQVEVPANIERVIPSGKLAQIMLFSLAPDKLVGLASKWDDSAKGIIPDKYYDMTVYGQFYGSDDMNLEELAKANPQLVIDIGDSKEDNTEDLDNFTLQTGVPIVYIYSDLESAGDAYVKLGELLGEEEAAALLSGWVNGVYERALSIMDKVGDNKVKGLYVMGEEGLNVLAQGSYHAEVIDLLMDNLAVMDNPSSKGSGNEVSMEQIALWNPDFVVFKADSIYSTVKDMETWAGITAIANDNYVECPNTPDCWLGMPPSVQRYLSLIWLPSVLYPDYVDYDVKSEIIEGYEMLYHTTITDEQYEQLTANAFLK